MSTRFLDSENSHIFVTKSENSHNLHLNLIQIYQKHGSFRRRRRKKSNVGVIPSQILHKTYRISGNVSKFSHMWEFSRLPHHLKKFPHFPVDVVDIVDKVKKKKNKKNYDHEPTAVGLRPHESPLICTSMQQNNIPFFTKKRTRLCS